MGETAQTTTTRMYASIRDQLVSEIAAGVYPAGALLPSIREIMERWEVSTTTARKVLDELAAAGYARKEGTRGAISTGGPQPGPAPSAINAALGRQASVALDHAVLHLDGAANGIDDAATAPAFTRGSAASPR